MKVSEAIKARYSCRSYSPKQVAKEIILELLALANQAPSAGNQQNREFIVITDKESRDYLGKMNNQVHLAEAPVVILVVAKLSQETVSDYLKSLEKWAMTVSGVRPGEVKVTKDFEAELREMKYKWLVSDVATAVENLMLAAVEKGLSTCWIGIMDFKGVAQKFNLPGNVVPVCLVTLGYPQEPPKYRASRKNIAELIHWEKY